MLKICLTFFVIYGAAMPVSASDISLEGMSSGASLLNRSDSIRESYGIQVSVGGKLHHYTELDSEWFQFGERPVLSDVLNTPALIDDSVVVHQSGWRLIVKDMTHQAVSAQMDILNDPSSPEHYAFTLPLLEFEESCQSMSNDMMVCVSKSFPLDE